MIENKTRKKVLMDKTRIVTSVWGKGLGLMFRPKPDYALVFKFNKPRKVDLTMWFVFYPIDVLYLDSNLKVVEILKDFKPFTHHSPSSTASLVVEFPTGKLKDTKVGDLIKIKDLH